MEKQYNGILVVNKLSGMTSRDVVNKVSHILKTKKVGHTGTLDPLATGLLILTIGKCTKLSDFLTSSYKTYIVTFRLGYITDTLDITGNVTNKSDKKVTENEIKDVIDSYVGYYDQEVPAYSAVKIDGKKLYEYARNGEDVELPKRKVHIKSINDVIIGDDISMTVTVSKGTYIRSLVRDIGESLGTYAVMTSLTRINQSGYSIDDAFTLESIENGNYEILGIDRVLKDVKSIECDDALYKKVSNGVKLDAMSDEYVLFTYDSNFIALYKKDNEYMRMYVKF